MGQNVSKKERQLVMDKFKLDDNGLKPWLDAFHRQSNSLRKDRMTRADFMRAFECTGETEESRKRLFDLFDEDRNGSISFSEFVFATLINARVPSCVKLKAAFEVIDEDGNGFIDQKELLHLAERASKSKCMILSRGNGSVTRQLVTDTFKRMDVNGDGEISLEEFLSQVKKHGAWILDLFNINCE